MRGNDDGHPGDITEMPGSTGDAEDARKATAQPQYTSKYNTTQDSAKGDIVTCPSRRDINGTNDLAKHEVPGIQTVTCAT